jgi:hypothetical protein
MGGHQFVTFISTDFSRTQPLLSICNNFSGVKSLAANNKIVKIRVTIKVKFHDLHEILDVSSHFLI